MLRNVSRERVCAVDGCNNVFIAGDKANIRKYCDDCRIKVRRKWDKTYRDKMRALKPIAPKKLSLRSQRQLVTSRRERAYEARRNKAISMSPNVSKLLSFSPDNGKTIIYCKDAEQLDRARETFSNIYKR